MTLKRILSTNKGSAIIDAACCIPVFVIAMGIILSLITQAGHEARAVRGLTEASNAAVLSFAASDSSDAAAAAAFYAAYYLYYKDEGCENGGGLPFASFGNSERLAGGLAVDNVARVSVRQTRTIPVPKAFIKGIVSEKHLYFRPFFGESGGAADYDPERVYVFPKSGERYHCKGCRVLYGGGIPELLSGNIRTRYRPCKLCKPEELGNGASVCLYSSESGAYHRKECPVISKSYISMPKSEALRRGYTPCMICGGKE